MKLSARNLKVMIESLKPMPLHPEVIKYLQQQRIKGGKARWANLSKEERKKQMAKTHEGARKYWAERRKK